ncbi:MAG: serine/threonine protein kinase, partial [Myxococcales bacterium]|nr:serine/threonine protein kinase [Myxococcales bacterium]
HDEETLAEPRPRYTSRPDELGESVPAFPAERELGSDPTVDTLGLPRSDPPRPLSDHPRPLSEPPSVSTQSTLTSTLVRRREEAERARALSVVAGAGALATIIALLIGDTASPSLWVAIGWLAVTAIGAGSGFVMDRMGHAIGPRRLLAMGLLATIAILALIVHIGVFSLAVVPLFVGTYYFGMTDAHRDGWAVFGVGAGGYSLLVVLTLLGVLNPSDAVLSLREPPSLTAGSIAVVIVGFLGLTLWLARRTRVATLEAMARVERAQRQLRGREALLNEVRADLGRALEHAKLGRFSGEAIDGYLLGDVIGRGGMGEVYRAEPLDGSEPVAFKVLHAFAAAEPAHVERLMRECAITRNMDSKHIVRVLGSGRARDGTPYLVMELLRGRDLGELLRETRRLSLKQTLELTEHVAEALNVARAQGVVHRDLKPQNLFRSEEPGGALWKVLDFGVSKLQGSNATLTRGSTIGTPSYMAPEQARGREVDHRADIFALGVNVYRALTGRPAFTGPDMMATLYNVVHVQPVKPSDVIRLGTPEQERAINLVLALALAKDPARRFSSATLFAAALRDASQGQLDQRLEVDAEALLQAQPWGRDVTEPTESVPPQG